MPDWLLKLCESRPVRALLPAIAGFLGYGSWGYFCNMMYGWQMGLQSGLVQGSLSFTITLVFNGVMETIYRLVKRKALSIAISIISLVTVSYGVNNLTGTPEVIATIAPGVVIGAIYVFSYISTLAKLDQGES